VWLPIQRDDDARRPIYQRRMEQCRRIGTEARLPSDSRCAANNRGRGRAARAEVGSQDDVGVEQGDQGVEVTTSGCQKEGIDYRALTSEVGVGDLGASDPAPCPTRQLPGRNRGSTHHGGDLLERQLEHVVEHEGQALSRSQSIQYDLERQADRVGE